MHRFIAVVFWIPSFAFGFYSTHYHSSSPTQMNIELKLNVKELKLSRQQQGQETFVKVEHTTSLPENLEGTPDIPRIHQWLAIPEGSRYQLKVTVSDPKIYSDVLLAPVQADALETETPQFTIRRSEYQKDVWVGGEGAEMADIGKLGSISILPVTFTPVQYNAARRELKVYQTLRAELTSLTPEIAAFPRSKLNHFVREQLKGLVLNADHVLQGQEAPNASNYLIASSKELMPYAKQLGALRRRDGANVLYLEVPAAVPATKIADLVKTQHQSLNLDAVLLFGDERQIPLYKSPDDTLGDVFYSFVEGADQISDIAVGRLPVSDATEANIIISKMTKYRELQASGQISKNVMLLAHNENYPGKYTANQEEVRKAPNPKGLVFETQYGGNKATNAKVIESANQNRYAIINYRGHGNDVSWVVWDADDASFSYREVENLPDDATKLAVYFNEACNNGAIQNSADALVEKQLFPKKGSSYQGAVGTFGATEPSYTEVNHRFNKYLFSFLQSSADLSMGNIYTLANNKLTQENGGKAPPNVEMYVLYSDPLLKPLIE